MNFDRAHVTELLNDELVEAIRKEASLGDRADFRRVDEVLDELSSRLERGFLAIELLSEWRDPARLGSSAEERTSSFAGLLARADRILADENASRETKVG